MSNRPRIAETAPTTEVLTAYDISHLSTYLRLLDADAEGPAWADVARVVLDLDPEKDPVRSNRIWASHLGRARWIAAGGDDLLFNTDFWKAEHSRYH